MSSKNQKVNFVEVEEAHLSEILDIYNHYILNSTATFHTTPLSPEEMRKLVYFHTLRYRTFVIMQEQRLCGYVLLAQHKVREAYKDTAEVTIYLHPQEVGKGLGRLAVDYIEAFARTQQFHVLVATICGDNIGSIRLFEQCGYAKCAHYQEVGKKFGQWLDVVAYQKILT